MQNAGEAREQYFVHDGACLLPSGSINCALHKLGPFCCWAGAEATKGAAATRGII